MARTPRRRESHAERRERRGAVDDLDTVLEAAARFLESRSRSMGEVRRRLTSAGYRPALVEDAITRLVELGFLDDEAFASAWVESRDRAHPRGEHALRRELGQKGIERAVVEEVLAARRGDRQGDDPAEDGAEPSDPDRDAALRLLDRRRSALLREPDPRKRRQKAYALLARNGFAPDVASEVSRQVADPVAPDDG